MADWYVSSAAYTGYTAWVGSNHAYSIGDVVVPTAPALKAKWALRCTTAGSGGTAEPTWPTANNGTVTCSGGTGPFAIFTNVTGQSTYGWGAAAGDIPTLLGAVGTIRFVGGDRMFVSSDHSETQTSTTSYGSPGTATFNATQVLSVNRAGSVPPVAADLTAGATVTVSGTTTTLNLDCSNPVYHYGMNYVYTATFATAVQFASATGKTAYFDACQIYLNTSTAASKIQQAAISTVVLYNTTLRFGAAAHTIQLGTLMDFSWLNTTSALAGAIFPTTLFTPTNGGAGMVMARGVDFSALTGTLFANSGGGIEKVLLDSCRLASGATRYAASGSTNTRDVVELVNCYDGTNFISESYQTCGTVTTEFTITLSGGASDNVGTFSHKMVSNANIDKRVQPLVGFWMDVNYATTGSSKTATVEIISSASLNNDEISLELEYLGTSASSVASFANSLPATALTVAAAVTTSTATWNSSPATPQKQKLQVTFTPLTAGRVRARVRLGKASATVYYDPQVTIT